jgi:mannose-6-phosphate isomerase-like protein (cupin superfamily)
MQTPFIIHNNEADEYFFEEGCYILEVSNAEKDESLSIARARLSPNTTTRLHKLSQTIERYIIISGKGMVTVGELPETTVQANDVVIIPEGCPQMIRNIGDSDLLFFVVCTPRFLASNYSNC